MLIMPESHRQLSRLLKLDFILFLNHSSKTEGHLGCNCSLMFFAAVPLKGLSSCLVGHSPSLTPCGNVQPSLSGLQLKLCTQGLKQKESSHLEQRKQLVLFEHFSQLAVFALWQFYSLSPEVISSFR